MNIARPRRRALIVALTVLVLMAGVAAATVDMFRSRSDVDQWTADRAEVVESVVQDVINGVFNDLEAVAAFIEESDPNRESFSTFVAQIDGNADAVGIAYIEIVAAADIADHIAQRQQSFGDFYDVSGLSPETGLPVPIDRTDRDEFYPMQLFTFGDMIRPLISNELPISELGIGMDAGYESTWRDEVTSATVAEGRTLSRFITIDAVIFRVERAFFASVPVRSRDGQSAGIVGALLIEPLLMQNLDNRALDDVKWEVVPIGGSPTRLDSHDARIYSLEVPGTPWSIAVAPTDEAIASLVGQPYWVTGMIATILAALFALVMWLLIDRRTEHRRSVRLRALADEKDRFLATVSHELRTPLTVVSGVANELHDKPAGFSPKETEGLLAMIVEQTDELAAIVEDLLIAARNDIGKVVVNLQEIDLAVEATRAMETAGIAAPLIGTPGIAIADDQRVRQILRNLLTNARRYGGPTVQIEFSAGPGWVEVAIVDDGAGIPEDKWASVFEAYESAHLADRAVRSVGLGLFISRSLANAMSGDLQYEYAHGCSRFGLRLPAAKLDSARPQHHLHPSSLASD